MTNPMPLTPRQAEILDFMRQYRATHGSTPTIWKVQRHFGFQNWITASDHLKRLELKGLVRLEKLGRLWMIVLVEA